MEVNSKGWIRHTCKALAVLFGAAALLFFAVRQLPRELTEPVVLRILGIDDVSYAGDDVALTWPARVILSSIEALVLTLAALFAWSLCHSRKRKTPCWWGVRKELWLLAGWVLTLALEVRLADLSVEVPSLPEDALGGLAFGSFLVAAATAAGYFGWRRTRG